MKHSDKKALKATAVQLFPDKEHQSKPRSSGGRPKTNKRQRAGGAGQEEADDEVEANEDAGADVVVEKDEHAENHCENDDDDEDEEDEVGADDDGDEVGADDDEDEVDEGVAKHEDEALDVGAFFRKKTLKATKEKPRKHYSNEEFYLILEAAEEEGFGDPSRSQHPEALRSRIALTAIAKIKQSVHFSRKLTDIQNRFVALERLYKDTKKAMEKALGHKRAKSGAGVVDEAEAPEAIWNDIMSKEDQFVLSCLDQVTFVKKFASLRTEREFLLSKDQNVAQDVETIRQAVCK